jgi:hypothetical protein
MVKGCCVENCLQVIRAEGGKPVEVYYNNPDER